MSERYILEGGNPVPCGSLMEWGNWMEKADRHVALTEIGDVKVSTVFLGLDHSFGGPTPILFETLVFGGEHDGDMNRYATREDAEQGHAQMVAKVSANEK